MSFLIGKEESEEKGIFYRVCGIRIPRMTKDTVSLMWLISEEKRSSESLDERSHRRD
jgi:hypothetical protein